MRYSIVCVVSSDLPTKNTPLLLDLEVSVLPDPFLDVILRPSQATFLGLCLYDPKSLLTLPQKR